MTEKQPTILLTGAAGFIGAHLAEALLGSGHRVIAVDNLNDYYSAALKKSRLERLEGREGFSFHKVDISDHAALAGLPGLARIDKIVHLAAQAGVRHSIDAPFSYADSNLVGHLSILELARRLPQSPPLIYASSSSVYGANTKTPYAESDPVNDPVSLYAATKRSCELMSEAYSRLYGIEQIGLRFFTVYGPWGRPDMAYWIFTEKIFEGAPIRVFNNGDLRRDFTYIDDIVNGVVAVLSKPFVKKREVAHNIYNIGNNTPVPLLRFIEIIENAAGRKAEKVMAPMQPGDVFATCADIAEISADYGFKPGVSLETGIPKFIDWYKTYFNIDNGRKNG